jgi:hypothetical protein
MQEVGGYLGGGLESGRSSPCCVLCDGEGHYAVPAHDSDGGTEAHHAVDPRRGEDRAASLTAHSYSDLHIREGSIRERNLDEVECLANGGAEDTVDGSRVQKALNRMEVSQRKDTK